MHEEVYCYHRECNGSEVGRCSESIVWLVYAILIYISTNASSLTVVRYKLGSCQRLPRTTPLTDIGRDFQEALETTAEAKRLFVHHKQDLFDRGRRLIRDSLACGVTHMRCHVEIDATVGSACLEAAIKLKREFKNICEIQIAGRSV